MRIAPKKIISNKRLHIYYSGYVQGIGFRYIAQKLASPLSLTGWVKNLPDSRVEILCEGKEADIETFMQKITDIFKDNIRNTAVEWSEAKGEFDGFDVQF
jgi:acylphosphatase